MGAITISINPTSFGNGSIAKESMQFFYAVSIAANTKAAVLKNVYKFGLNPIPLANGQLLVASKTELTSAGIRRAFAGVAGVSVQALQSKTTIFENKLWSYADMDYKATLYPSSRLPDDVQKSYFCAAGNNDIVTKDKTRKAIILIGDVELNEDITRKDCEYSGCEVVCVNGKEWCVCTGGYYPNPIRN